MTEYCIEERREGRVEDVDRAAAAWNVLKCEFEFAEVGDARRPLKLITRNVWGTVWLWWWHSIPLAAPGETPRGARHGYGHGAAGVASTVDGWWKGRKGAVPWSCCSIRSTTPCAGQECKIAECKIAKLDGKTTNCIRQALRQAFAAHVHVGSHGPAVPRTPVTTTSRHGPTPSLPRAPKRSRGRAVTVGIAYFFKKTAFATPRDVSF